MQILEEKRSKHIEIFFLMTKDKTFDCCICGCSRNEKKKNQELVFKNR